MLGFARTVKSDCYRVSGDDVCCRRIPMARTHLPVVRTSGFEANAVANPVPRDPLVDGFARRIRYLRVSVTDRCNYRCTYCMPETLEDRMQFEPRAALL